MKISAELVLFVILVAIQKSYSKGLRPEKPGSCPRFRLEKTKCTKGDNACIKKLGYFCSSDYECPGDMKCCYFEFAFSGLCVKPMFPKKPGSCPRIRFEKRTFESKCKKADNVCIKKFGYYCNYDHECPGDMKCCSGRFWNVKSCEQPIYIQKPGSCPRFRFEKRTFKSKCKKADNVCIKKFGYYCNYDHECPGDMKCCSGRFWNVKSCEQPIYIQKPGSCPRFRFEKRTFKSKCTKADNVCIKKFGYYCNYDHECPGDMKCCSGRFWNVKSCEQPIYIQKPGSCPRIRFEKRTFESKCKKADNVCIKKFGYYCKYDHECPGDMKCCSGRFWNVKSCEQPIYIQKPGSCPRIRFEKRTFESKCKKADNVCIKKFGYYCKYDHECPGDMKCCSGRFWNVKSCELPIYIRRG